MEKLRLRGIKCPAEVPQLSTGGAGMWTWLGLSRLAQARDGYLKMVPTLNHAFPFSVQPCDRILSRENCFSLQEARSSDFSPLG